ncbi:MAG: hypothetical protein K6T83_14355 [Alicyclobacillus sp.]|nr:hypothetical protein [Alicyclobacillus sp.]
MTREPIRDENGKIIGMCDPQFLDRNPEVLYRLIKYACTACYAEFLMDERFVRNTRRDIYNLRCPMCGELAEAEAATSDETSDELEDWGCAYPNGMKWDEEQKIRQRLGE